MSNRIIDTHSHIHFKDYDADRGAVVHRAREAGVAMIAVGTDIGESRRALAMAETYPDDVVGATAGFHPTYDAREFNTSALREIAKHPRVRAIGECGLDYYRIESEEARIKQKEIFEAHIDLAHELQKPLVIHCRDAHADLLNILKANSRKLKAGRAGVMHFFGGEGSWENVKDYIDTGFYISFAGVVTFKNYTHAEDIKRLPLERIVVETDAPYVAPAPHRGERNEPAYIVETVRRIAELRAISEEECGHILLQNAKKLFSM